MVMALHELQLLILTVDAQDRFKFTHLDSFHLLLLSFIHNSKSLTSTIDFYKTRVAYVYMIVL